MHPTWIYYRTVSTLKRYSPLRTVLSSKVILTHQQKKHVSTDFPTKGKQWFKPWKWYFPVGFGVSLFSIYIWEQWRKKPQDKSTASKLVVNCYCFLPLRITSRIWGWLASVELPTSLRPSVYKMYAKTFSANLEEIDLDLASFPSLADFFVRTLRDDVRPIAENTNIVSPADGKILHIGPVTHCYVEQVKGVTYDLREFLGDGYFITDDSPEAKTKYISSLLKNSDNQLYQLSIYLAPGDYHRFHSPADWKINSRKHFQGKLLSVNPSISSWVPNLFSLNERAVYCGEWEGGFMAYAVIGATNVGSIRVYRDSHLITNTRKWPRGKIYEEAKFDNFFVKKGELLGEFRMGSTIVMLFEAPKDFIFSFSNKQRIQVGQGITNCNIKNA